jgi:hypothetical protein
VRLFHTVVRTPQGTPSVVDLQQSDVRNEDLCYHLRSSPISLLSHQTPTLSGTGVQKAMVLLLVASAGCGGSSTSEIPHTLGAYVNDARSIGIGWEIGSDVSGHPNSDGVSTESSIEADFFEPEQADTRKRFALGADIPIRLDSIHESEWRSIFNDCCCDAFRVVKRCIR